MQANFIIYDNEATINNISSIKEFNDKIFTISINNEDYLIKGIGLELKEVNNENTTIKISGTILSFEKGKHKKEKDKSFLKKLFN